MPLVFLPDTERLFLWGDVPRALAALIGPAHDAILLTPDGRAAVPGRLLPLLDAAAALASLPAASLDSLPASVAIWGLASKLALELAARERVVPAIVRTSGGVEARWAVALAGGDDAARVAAIAAAMPPAAHAVPASPEGAEVWAPHALLRAYLDAVVDALLRQSRGAVALPGHAGWERRWRAALEGPTRELAAGGFAERSLPADLARWSEPALGARDRLRACFRLELPEGARDPFTLRFLLQAPDDPSLLVTAAEVWRAKGRSLQALGRAFRDPQESLLEALGRAARLHPPLAPALDEARPESLALDPAAAFAFLAEGAPVLAEAGFGVLLPAELTAGGRRRLRLRMRVSGGTSVAGVVEGTAGLSLADLLTVDYEAVIGDEALTARELAALARQKAPLVRHRGAWVAVDPRELAEIQRRVAGGPERVGAGEALRAALAGESRRGELTAQVAATGVLADLLERLRAGADRKVSVPASLAATLRPYQERGLAWLTTLASLGLGACLADDMGLGKTVQLLAFLLRRAHDAPGDVRPSLIVAPTSVVGNWEREAQRFAPSLRVVRHLGPGRTRDAADLPERALVLTTYGTLRRDAERLAAGDFAVVALDEAQNVKNAASATARAARALPASVRIALTGTPVENRLAELWSILEFANPGLLGPLERFHREIAVPVERYGDEAGAARLRAIAGPFVLRRLKSDPAVLPDLPPRSESKVLCTLTREQASLYKAVVDEELRRVQEAEGMERRGRVLALLTYSKQICNHPAQYLGERGPLAGRSGKLARLTEMLEEALAEGDRALVFTQFREMGEHLAAHVADALGTEVLFLHGGTPRAARDEMVRRFQDDPAGPRVFVLSLRAGGTGLNLTAAAHVFHYDRWWNPAVEDQATDRAHRIGQTRRLQVHKLTCAGTVEDRIDELLLRKRELARKVVGAGERWITELPEGELRELFALSKGAVVDDDEPAPRRAGGAR